MNSLCFIFLPILIGEKDWTTCPSHWWSKHELWCAEPSVSNAAGSCPTGDRAEPSAEEKHSSREKDREAAIWATAPERDLDTGGVIDRH